MSTVNIGGGKTEGGRSGATIASVASDSVDVGYVVRVIHCNTGGNLKATAVDDTDGTSQTYVLLPGVQYGGWQFKRIWSTGTTATGIIGK